jgi:hypothetical protein
MEHNLITNIRLRCKRLPTTNCLAYLTESPVKKNKSLMSLTKITYNLFFWTTYTHSFRKLDCFIATEKSLLLCDALALKRISTPYE